ncbi:MAG: FecR domain-containing protein [Anaerolineae bacterium]|nr:FecR domain-containing protein [Anaerolineae bacterium]
MINSTASDHTALTPDQEPPDRGAERSAQSHDSPGWVTRRFRANPMRTAWVVTVISFITCCALAIAAPLTARGFVLYATDTRPLELNVIDGAVLVTTARTRDTQAVVSRAPVSEDQRVATDEKSSAILTFYADEKAQESLATITLYNNASFLLTTARVPRFSYSGAADRLSLYLEHGRIRVSPSHRSARPLQVVVETPHGSAHLPDGSYSVEVRNEETRVTTRGGEATVIAGGQVVIVLAGERTRIAAGQAPDAPQPVEQDLLGQRCFARQPGWLEQQELCGRAGRCSEERRHWHGAGDHTGWAPGGFLLPPWAGRRACRNRDSPGPPMWTCATSTHSTSPSTCSWSFRACKVRGCKAPSFRWPRKSATPTSTAWSVCGHRASTISISILRGPGPCATCKRSRAASGMPMNLPISSNS